MTDVFKALSDPTRRAIVDELRQRDGQSLFELCARLATNHGSTSSRQAVSQHLGVLEAAGLVRSERKGRYKLLFLDTAPLTPVVERWLAERTAPAPARTTAPATGTARMGMKVTWVSLFVDDQEHGLRFYTEVLGFITKHDVPVGDCRWVTVVSPLDPDGIELVLEPTSHPAVRQFRDALTAEGTPFTSFAVDDVDAEYRRLHDLGVHFIQPPTAMGETTTAVFDDTCGNLIQMHHHAGQSAGETNEEKKEN
ncbi:DNA-binding transcriptional regulator, ArsR family [Glycomyces sambucus]|uniref:DNA-binding transcriptional regulator, ArsR family n=2 Tax=Glycomyces sambucus TaxID=380244 RepID=A0A1G9CFN0_9ACTN|nr:VOC family protein [Glycomyces sambucus]SDK50457.1 DNA-binding transcriptional regulator, ArsR family [Glycomyces sambucus]